MKIKVKRTIQAPTEALWPYLADYANIAKFHPLLKGSAFIEGSHTCEVGTTRQCDMKDGNYIKERVTDWQEGSHYTIEVYETSMPVKDSSATIGVRSIGNGRSEAYMDLNMTPKNRIMQPMMFMYFRFIAGPGILKGLEEIHARESQVVAV